MPKYDVHFSNGAAIHFEDTACFSELASLSSSIDWHFDENGEGDEPSLHNDKVTKIVYHIDYHDMLSDEEVDRYLSYLFNHKQWSPMIRNKSVKGIRKNGLNITANLHGEEILAVLTAFRYLEEFPRMVKTFFYLSTDKGKKEGLSFALSHLFVAWKDKPVTYYHNLGGHHLICDSCEIGALISMAKGIPLKPVSGVKYNECYETGGVFNMMSQYHYGSGVMIFAYQDTGSIDIVAERLIKVYGKYKKREENMKKEMNYVA